MSLVEIKVITITARGGHARGDLAVNLLYNRGRFGRPEKGGLRLTFVEAAYLLESDRVGRAVAGKTELTPEDILKASGEEGILTRYIVYSDLRSRGLYVREAGGNILAVWNRGSRPGETEPEIKLTCASERERADLEAFADSLSTASSNYIVAVVDEESDITYYEARLLALESMASWHPPVPEQRIRIEITGGIGISRDGTAMELARETWLGKEVSGAVRYSLLEVDYLMSKGLAEVWSEGRQVRNIRALGERLQPGFGLRAGVFGQLRDLGYIVKTGFKYGTHFRVYEEMKDEAHAPYLVQAVGRGEEITWEELSRAVRLAHGVKKTMVFALAECGPVFVTLARIKM